MQDDSESNQIEKLIHLCELNQNNFFFKLECSITCSELRMLEPSILDGVLWSAVHCMAVKHDQ